MGITPPSPTVDLSQVLANQQTILQQLGLSGTTLPRSLTALQTVILQALSSVKSGLEDDISDVLTATNILVPRSSEILGKISGIESAIIQPLLLAPDLVVNTEASWSQSLRLVNSETGRGEVNLFAWLTLSAVNPNAQTGAVPDHWVKVQLGRTTRGFDSDLFMCAPGISQLLVMWPDLPETSGLYLRAQRQNISPTNVTTKINRILLWMTPTE